MRHMSIASMSAWYGSGAMSVIGILRWVIFKFKGKVIVLCLSSVWVEEMNLVDFSLRLGVFKEM